MQNAGIENLFFTKLAIVKLDQFGKLTCVLEMKMSASSSVYNYVLEPTLVLRRIFSQLVSIRRLSASSPSIKRNLIITRLLDSEASLGHQKEILPVMEVHEWWKTLGNKSPMFFEIGEI